MKIRLIVVIVNGLPGKMAREVCNQIVNADNRGYNFSLYGNSLTGPETQEEYVYINNFPVNLFKPDEKDNLAKQMAYHDYFFIAVDFSHPSAVIENAEWYCDNNIPFVMGTTGGNREQLKYIVSQSGNCAVIAPNMAKQVVTFQAMMEFAAKNSPDVFKDYTLRIVESHQKGKADTSGTAKAMVNYFNSLGIPFSPDQIEMVRDPDEQKAMGIPEEALSGHGWHTYSLRSPDGSTFFQFTHNVNGRDIYALGTLDAINFLAKNIRPGNVYSMTDVLRG
jgi:4-hydroxy-tetrahydrodipicolinate reductase